MGNGLQPYLTEEKLLIFNLSIMNYYLHYVYVDIQ